MFGMPETTQFDLRFRMLGIPVRVHPLFWLVSALLGAQGGELQDIVIWIACVFVSILAHEFGHGLMARAFGYPASIVLYGMGGLCYSEAERQTPGQRLAVLFAGPGAGFLIAGLVLWSSSSGQHLSHVGEEVVWDLWQINVFWSIINLLPVWPLDGGQITGVFATLASPRRGVRWTHVISLLTASVVALLVFSYTRGHELFLPLMFALLAIQNFQILQSIHRQYAQYGGGDEADWWKR
jgi:stage IV sporulation protein FB